MERKDQLQMKLNLLGSAHNYHETSKVVYRASAGLFCILSVASVALVMNEETPISGAIFMSATVSGAFLFDNLAEASKRDALDTEFQMLLTQQHLNEQE